jgi:hypothetical protein
MTAELLKVFAFHSSREAFIDSFVGSSLDDWNARSTVKKFTSAKARYPLAISFTWSTRLATGSQAQAPLELPRDFHGENEVG